MTRTISISPLTRIEGHLSVYAETEPLGSGQQSGFRVKAARCEGEMFRGLEKILEGATPWMPSRLRSGSAAFAPCRTGIASIRAQEMAYGIAPSPNGRLMQNLIFAANYLHSHVLHFYQLAALDFVDVKAILRYSGNDRILGKLKAWVGRRFAKEVFRLPLPAAYEAGYAKDLDANLTLLSHYAEALEIRRGSATRWGRSSGQGFRTHGPGARRMHPGRQPGTGPRLYRPPQEGHGIRPGRVSAGPAPRGQGVPGYFDMGRGCGNFLCYGVFLMDDAGNKFIKPGVLIEGKWERLDPGRILEDVGCSRFSSPSGCTRPVRGNAAGGRQERGVQLDQAAALPRLCHGSRAAGPRAGQLPRSRRLVGQEGSGQPAVREKISH